MATKCIEQVERGPRAQHSDQDREYDEGQIVRAVEMMHRESSQFGSAATDGHNFTV
jgi:hypothetical protein